MSGYKSRDPGQNQQWRKISLLYKCYFQYQQKCHNYIRRKAHQIVYPRCSSRLHPVLKYKRFHNGQDIAVPTGTKIKAVDHGIVVVCGWQGGYGNYIAINHGNGISSCYGHNSKLLVKKGQRVYKGQIIAFAGSTGLSTGPHLHFEIRRNGVPVNPLPYLP